MTRRSPSSTMWWQRDAAGRGVSRRSFLSNGGALLALRAAPLRAAVPLLPAYPQVESPLCVASSRTTYPRPLETFLSRLNPAADDFVSEWYVAEIEPILSDWTSSLRRSPRDETVLRRTLAATFRGRSMIPTETVALRSTGPLRVERRSFRGEAMEREAFLSAWTHSLSPFASIETLELQIFGVRVHGDVAPSVDTEVRYDLVGTTRDGAREERVGTWHLSWTSEAARGEDSPGAMRQQRSWTVRSWTAGDETRSRLTGRGFTEITGACLAPDAPGMAQLLPGIDHWRSALDGASGIDVFGNHGLAVGDIDGGGYDSFYVCQPSGLPNRLYRNRGDGTFEDITERSGTGILDGTAAALFADFQNRGKQDLLVVRSSGPLLFEAMGEGRFEPRPEAFRFKRPPQGAFTGAAVADYNRDGLLDVYFCLYSYYKGLDHHQYPSPYYDAQNGPPNFLFQNRGDGTFGDVTAASGMDQNNNRFSFAASWCDDDEDGWPDLYVANDFGRKNLYRNHGDGTFADVAAAAGVEDYGPGMSTCWLDANNDGRQDLYVANMWLAEGKRITADDQFLPHLSPAVRALYQKHNAGNSLYQNVGQGRFEDRSAAAGTAVGGWSWSCASWDFDNDGWSDLYVANGFVSGANHYDLQSFFWRQVAQRSLTPEGVSPEYEAAWNAINELLRSDYTWSGYQRNVFFANNRDGSFSMASGVLGLDLIDDGRAYGLSDIDHDGRLELVFKNRTGPQVRVLRNDMEGIGNSITLRLRGHTSNRDAIGATVTIEAGAARQVKFVAAGSGFASQHTKELCFGVGEAGGPISVSVRWPTGKVDRYGGLAVNHRIYVEEGIATVTATPYRSTASIAVPAAQTGVAAVVASAESVIVNPWLITPLFGPDLRLTDLKGGTRQLSALRGKPVLLTFVSAGCDRSVEQLAQLQGMAGKLAEAGLSLFTVARDPGGNRKAIEALVADARCSLPVCVADEQSAGAWDLQYRYLFDRRQNMPVPSSFLLDGSGAVLRVYRGVIAPESVIDDWTSAPQTAQQRFARAIPFAGPYYGAPMTHDYLSFGIAFSESGYVDEAGAAFQRAIDANPALEVAWFNLGTIYLNKKMYAQARICLNEAVRLNPGDSDAWNNLGSISGTEQKYDEALEEFRRAALADPHHAKAVDNMMRIYQFQRRAADAQKTLEELVAKAPETASLHLALSITLVAQNDLERARQELETAVRLDPRNPDAMNNLGAVLLHMGLDKDALAEFERCRRMAPDFDRATVNVALLYNKAGDHEKARQVLEEFLTRHPKDAAVRGALDRMATP